MFKTTGVRKVAFTGALLLLSGLAACKNEDPQVNGAARDDVTLTGHVLSGSATSPVRIDVFSDLQCPSCRELFIQILQPVMKEYKDKVSIVYHEFPLSGHRYAHPAARYVAAAGRLGQPQMLSVYDAIFNDQAYWATDGNLEASVSKGISGEDFARVQQILQNSNSLAEINNTIQKEQQLGIRKGVNVTPTMFISHGGSEQKVEGRPTYQVMKQFLDSIVK